MARIWMGKQVGKCEIRDLIRRMALTGMEGLSRKGPPKDLSVGALPFSALMDPLPTLVEGKSRSEGQGPKQIIINLYPF